MVTGGVQTAAYYAGDAPYLVWDLVDADGNAQDITGAEVALALTPREAGVPRITASLFAIDPANGRVAFAVLGGTLPTDPYSATLATPPVGSFSQACTYDGLITVRGGRGPGETITYEAFLIVILPRP